jgi:RHS repeat-associated protein
MAANPAATIASHGRIIRYRNDHTAVVRTPTGLEVESSTAPLRVTSADGEKLPVDLDLIRGEDGIEPTNPVQPTVIGDHLDQGVDLTASGISLSLIGSDAPAEIVGGSEAFYGEVATDTDAVATPRLDGVDLSALLRSADSPEELRYRVGLPLGARLVGEDGGAVIRRGDAVIGRIPAVWARDAQGTPVPVTLAISGDELDLRIPHRGGSYAYPIFVDPVVSDVEEEEASGYWFTGSWVDYLEVANEHEPPGFLEPGITFAHDPPGNVSIEQAYLPLVDLAQQQAYAYANYGKWPGFDPDHHVTHVYFDGVEASGLSGPHSFTDYWFGACGQEPTWFAPGVPPAEVVIPQLAAWEPCSEFSEPENRWHFTYGPPYIGVESLTDLRWELESGPPHHWVPGEQVAVGPVSLSVAAVIASWSMTWEEEQALEIGDSEMYGDGNPAQLTNTDCMAGDPVNCATGDLVESQEDLSVGGRGPGLAARRTYNSQLAAVGGEGSFGWGWTSAYEDKIEITEKCIANCEEEIISSVAMAKEDARGEEEEPSPGPVAAYSFDEGEGEVAGDSAGEHDGAVSGAAWVPGKFGPALRFEGDGEDKVTVPSSPDLELTEGFTIDAWVKPGVRYNYYPVVEKETPGSFGYEFGLSGGVWPTASVHPEGSYAEEVFGGEPIPRHKWSNVAVTYDGTHLRLYVDGELSGTEAVSAPRGGAGALLIGSSEPFGFTGKIDELRIYDRALDGEEIQMEEATPIGTTEGSGGDEIEPDEIEVREEAAVVYAENGSTAEFRRIQGEPDWSPASPLDRAELRSEGEGFGYTLPDQTVLDFDSSGRLASEEDADGNTVTVNCDGEGRITSVSDESGRELVYTYDPEGFVESIEDPMGHIVKYGYEDENLVSVSQPDSAEPRWQFGYNEHHLLTSVTNGRGGVTRTKYSSLHVVRQEDPMGRVTHWAYSSGEGAPTTTITEPNGSETVEQFNSEGLITSATKAAGTPIAATTTYEYNPAEELTARTNADGQTTEFEYDEEGDKIGETGLEGEETTWTYDGAHRVLAETNPSGEKTTIVRDAHGNPESISRPAPGSQTQTTSFEYGAHGELESTTDPLGATWTYGYGGHGDRTAETDPEGDERKWAYDGDSRTISVISPRGNKPGAEPKEFTTSIERDAQGRPMKVTDPLGGATEYAYDPEGNLESVADQNGHETRFAYDADDEQTKVERPDGAVEETGYDEAGQVISQTDGNGDETTYVRNALEEPVETVDPLERTTTRTFDPAGNLETLTDPEGRTTTYDYDEAGRLGEVAYSAEPGLDVTYGYDEDGNLVSMVDGTGESSYEYDQLDRLVHNENGHGESTAWEYDLADEPIGLTYPNGKSISRGFDEAGRLESVTDWLGHTTSFSYNPDSEPTATDFPSGTGDTDEYTYDLADRMSGVTMKKGAETLASLAYARDPAGQVESLVSEGLPGPGEEEFGYDEDERLTQAGEAAYGYDAANNITEAPGTSNAYDEADQLESMTVAAFEYDEEGERTQEIPTTGPTTTYEYDQAGQLTGVERPEEGETAAVSESFAYDGTGTMASKTVGPNIEHLVWDPTASPSLLLSDEGDSYVYGPGGLPIEQISSEEVPTYLHHDQLGSTRLLTNSSGEATGTFAYGAYGALTGQTGTSRTGLGYAGQFTLGQSGLVYLRARVYDPGTGQFLTRDPLQALTREPYAYAVDNPVADVDPSGLISLSGVLGSIGEVLEPLNPIKYYEEEVEAWESGCGYWSSVLHGLQGASVAAADVSVVGGAVEIAAGVAGESGPEIDEANATHIFREAPGHLAEDTAENRALLEDAVTPANYAFTRPPGVSVYRESLPNGEQVWVEVYGGKITNGGVNETPR